MNTTCFKLLQNSLSRTQTNKKEDFLTIAHVTDFTIRKVTKIGPTNLEKFFFFKCILYFYCFFRFNS